MSWPSWFPTSVRPSNWPDWSTIYRRLIPREWPDGLFESDSEALKDLRVHGEALALVRDLLEWVLRTYFPHRDDWANYLARWETVFGISASGTVTDRKNRVTAAWRAVPATMTQAQLKVAIAPAFGAGADEISIVSPTAADIASAAPGADWQWVFLSSNLHIYHTNETTAPNQGMAEDIIAKIKPTGDTWSVGQYEQLVWGTPGEEGAWDQATWG